MRYGRVAAGSSENIAVSQRPTKKYAVVNEQILVGAIFSTAKVLQITEIIEPLM